MSSSTPKPPVVRPGFGNNIIVNPCQRLNPVLECIRNVGTEFGDIVADYQVGRTTGMLFLSLKYHRLHPEYILQRIERLGYSFNLRILLILCDITEHREAIRELTKTCLINNITIMVAWSIDEAGQYIATYKQFEHKPPDMIKERVDKDYYSILRATLTSIGKVNKTDVETLRRAFGSFANIAKATPEQLQSLPGFGQVKVKRIKDAFEKPFRANVTSSVAPTSEISGQSSSTSKGKGKEKADGAPSQSSPVWDIELDLDSPTAESSPLSESSTRATGKKRPPSPVWDIELDLN